MTPDHFRLFLSIELPKSLKDELERIQATLRRGCEVQARWTPPGQMHLTLEFLGDIAVSQVHDLTEAARAACRTFRPMQLGAAQIGFFPQDRRPHVVWAGVVDSGGQLPGLHRAIQQATLPFTSEPPETQFVGHLTLARIKFISRSETARLGQAAAKLAGRVFGGWTARGLSLMRSELSSEGARYSELAFVPFGAAGLVERPAAPST
jgi:RNA 2',3'-cyclic 3'-phosphodiesterase